MRIERVAVVKDLRYRRIVAVHMDGKALISLTFDNGRTVAFRHASTPGRVEATVAGDFRKCANPKCERLIDISLNVTGKHRLTCDSRCRAAASRHRRQC